MDKDRREIQRKLRVLHLPTPDNADCRTTRSGLHIGSLRRCPIPHLHHLAAVWPLSAVLDGTMCGTKRITKPPAQSGLSDFVEFAC